MPVSSVAELKERIEWLERELPPNPPRFKIYDALPFAILRYDPDQEWQLRREVRHLATRLKNAGIHVEAISLAELMWAAIESSEGIEAIENLERSLGFIAAQKQINTYLGDADFSPLVDTLSDRLNALDPSKSVAFLTRAAALAPNIYPISQLLEEMQGRTRTPAILFYPGILEGANRLRFMGMPDRDSLGNYRVKIYG